MYFFSDYVFTIRQIPQLWRLVTTFLITGPQLGLIMDPFFLYHYSSQLETGSPRFSRPGAYAFYLMFVSMIILVSASLISLGLLLSIPPAQTSKYLPGQPYRSCHGSWN
jgi:Derlin-2/3